MAGTHQSTTRPALDTTPVEAGTTAHPPHHTSDATRQQRRLTGDATSQQRPVTSDATPHQVERTSLSRPVEDTDQDAHLDDHTASHRRLRDRATRSVVSTVELVGFLTAIVLPLLYVPLLLVAGGDPARLLVVVGLVALHALSILLGYHYVPRSTTR